MNYTALLNALKDILPLLPQSVQRLMPPLLNALKFIFPRLPQSVQRLMPGFLAFLPLALEVARLLYKHRQEIRDTIENLTERTSTQAKQVSDSIAMTVPRLPKRVGRKLHRWLAYLPVALEIAKASYEKNSGKVGNFTAPLPSKVKKKIGRIVKKRIG